MINAAIVEDEPRNVRILKEMLNAFCPQITICGEATNVTAACELIKKAKPDIVFLDIEMPGGNAFTLLDQLKPVNFEVIFVTAYDNYTLKAIKYSALDYLLKPVNIEELIKAVDKVSEKINSLQFHNRIGNLLLNLGAPKNTLQSLAIPATFGYEFIIINNIIRCEASGKYTYFFLEDGRKIISVKNLKEYADILPPDTFFRIHHAHLINIRFIKRYHRGSGGVVEMKDNAKIPLATRRKKEFFSLFSGEE